MQSRLDFYAASPELAAKLTELSLLLLKVGSIERSLIDLTNIRASQLNGCAFCVDMHVKEAKIHGERELRIHHLTVWRESSLFTARERAALEWAEAVTELNGHGPAGHGVPDEVYERARQQFNEKEISDLTFSVATINTWNRLSISTRKEPGSADAFFGLNKAGLS